MMTYRYAILLLFVIFSCENPKKIIPEHKVIAKVNAEILSQDHIEHIMNAKIKKKNNDDLLRQYTKRWVQSSILFLEAYRLGYRLNESEEFLIENLKKEYIIQKYLQSRMKSLVISDRDIADYYESNKDEFKRFDDEYHMIHLFLPSRNKTIQTEINQSGDLLAVIQKFHMVKTVNDILLNGDLGFVKGRDLGSALKKRIDKARIDRIYGPIRIGSGFHYFQLKEKREAGTFTPLDDVKEVIKERLLNQKIESLKNTMIEEVKSQYVIKSKF